MSFSSGDKGGKDLLSVYGMLVLMYAEITCKKKKIKIHYLENKKQTEIKNPLIHCFVRVEADTAEGLNVASFN